MTIYPSNTRRPAPSAGFTLIEMMVVVLIISILAAVVLPRYADSLRNTQDSYTKGNLVSIRSALNMYYGQLEGQYPTDLNVLTVGGKFLRKIPPTHLPDYHTETSAVVLAASADDAGGWLYDGASGKVLVNCTHTDVKETVWTAY